MSGIDVARSDRLTADQVYERQWAFTVLEQVMARLRDEYRSAGNLRFFDQMKKMLMDEPDRPSQAEIASEFDMTENAVNKPFTDFVSVTKLYCGKRSRTRSPCLATLRMNCAISLLWSGRNL